MLTAQRFQLSVRAEGEAERWPPISLNTWSPPIPCLPPSPFLFFLPSLSAPLPSFFSLLIPGLARGLTALCVPACQKGPVILHPPSGTGEKKTHTHTHEHPHKTGFHKSTHPHTLSLHTQILFHCPKNTCTYKNFDCAWVMFCLLSAFLKMC